MNLLGRFAAVAAFSSVAAGTVVAGCSGSSDDDVNGDDGGGARTGIIQDASGGGTGSGDGGTGTGTTGGGTTGDGGAGAMPPGDAGTYIVYPQDGGGAPEGFWDAGTIPAATQVMTFAFLNRTNGKYADSEVYWSFKTGTIDETHSIAEQPFYDMPANSSGRMYFFLCATGDPTCSADPTKSPYYDFIEHTIGPTQYNGNTTRVDAFGIKLALRLHCADGWDMAVGEDYATFADDRATTFQQFLDFVPDVFDSLAQPPNAPYRIVQPGAGAFVDGGAGAHYYDSFVDEVWAANGITIPKPGPNVSGFPQNITDLSAALYRHVGNKAGTFHPDGTIIDQSIWADAGAFYQAPPADYYAAFMHMHALGGKQYAFPYDDVGGYSSYLSHDHPQYMLVAIGW
jgi:hypothetical protein